jgi:hypothetical protein
MVAFVYGLEHYLLTDDVLNFGSGGSGPVSSASRLRLALFIGTLGTFTAALGGGLDRQTVARHLALFSDRA